MTSAEFLSNDQMDPLFNATALATEEAIINAMVAAETMTGTRRQHHVRPSARPMRELMQEYNRLAE